MNSQVELRIKLHGDWGHSFMLIKIPSICRRQNLSILLTNMNTWLMMIDEILTQKIHVNLYYEYNCSMLPTQFIKSLNQNHFFKHVYFGFFFEGYALFFILFLHHL